ncbi:hypothetical protein AeMF1_007354, partial [Aphanomyces euteiches]
MRPRKPWHQVKSPDKGTAEGSLAHMKGLSERSNVRRLLDLMWLEWPSLCGGVVGLSVSSLVNLMEPLSVGTTVDVACGLPPPRGMSHRTFFLSIVAVFASGATASFLRVYCLGSVAQNTAQRLREQIYAAIIRQPMPFFTKNERTALVHSITEECHKATDAAVNLLIDGYRSVNYFVVASFMLVRISPKLTFMTMSALPILGGGVMAFKYVVKTLQRRYDAGLASLRASIDEKIGGIETVKLCTQESNEMVAFTKQTEMVSTAAHQAIAAEGVYMGGVSLATNLALSSVFWIGGSMLGNGGLTIGNLTSFMMYSGFLSTAFTKVSTLMSKVRSMNDSTQSLFDLLDQTPPKMTASSLQDIQGTVDFHDVTFGYPNKPPLLQNFTWHVPAGASVALVGSSGAGKSTVASLLTRLFEINGGQISLDGVDISTLDTTALRKYIGLVQQEANIFSGTILSNIKYANPTADYDEATAMASLTSIDDFSSAMPQGYDSPVVPSSLSGGQKQRLALARALLAKPKVLVLDEATVALDGNTEERILQAVKSKQTTIVIAHRLSTIR